MKKKHWLRRQLYPALKGWIYISSPSSTPQSQRKGWSALIHSQIFFPDDDNAQSRQPISVPDIKQVQSLSEDIGDEMRCSIALISDAGMSWQKSPG